MTAPRRIVYVVLNDGVNSRIGALAEFCSADVDVVYVTSRKVNVAPVPNLVVRPLLNPTGVFRLARMDRVKRALDDVLYFPTTHRRYVVPVIACLRKRIAEDLAGGAEVTVLTCAPPHALCMVGQALKARYPGIRWVVDWQDLWSYDASYFEQVPRWYRARAQRLERQLVHESDLNVTTNPRAKAALEAMHGAPSDRVVAIPHHFRCEEEGSSAAPTATAGGHRLVFMGGMLKPPKVPGLKFLDVMRRLRSEGYSDLELHLYGRQSPELEQIRPRAAEYGLVFHAGVPRARVIHELRQYDHQLLLLEDLPNSRLIMHLKLPEYLASGRPILAVVPSDSEVADIVRRTGTGWVVPAAQDWLEGLRTWLRSGTAPVRDEAAVREYAWDHIKVSWERALGL